MASIRQSTAAVRRRRVDFLSEGDRIAGALFLPDSSVAAPAVILCHGGLDFKENFYGFAEYLARRDVCALAIDMRGHGESEGRRFHVEMKRWVADIRAAIGFLENHPLVWPGKIGAFGYSSGGTAVLEAALVEPRLKTLAVLSATVTKVLRQKEMMFMHALMALGTVKKAISGRELRFSIVNRLQGVPFASDPRINKRITRSSRFMEAYSSLPFPGIADYVQVNTIDRVDGITAPTLVLHGQEDVIDPPETSLRLYQRLRSAKDLQIIPASGHAAHLDRNRDIVWRLTADWILQHLG